MQVYFDEIKISSKEGFEAIPITDRVGEIVKKSMVKNGSVTLFSQHTTGSVRVSEDEKSLLLDYKNFFEKLAPEKGKYGRMPSRTIFQ